MTDTTPPGGNASRPPETKPAEMKPAEPQRRTAARAGFSLIWLVPILAALLDTTSAPSRPGCFSASACPISPPMERPTKTTSRSSSSRAT